MDIDRRSGPRLFGGVIAALIAVACLAQTAHANWLSALLRDVGEAGFKGGAHLPSAVKLGPIGKAASHLAGMKSPPAAALAAHATPEGHWQFANRDGQLFTAANPEEMARVRSSLLPDAASAAGETKVSLYVSEDSFFRGRETFAALPVDAELHVVTASGAAYPVRRAANAAAPMLAEVTPHLTLPLADAALFGEAMAFLARPLNRADMRPLAVTVGGPKIIPYAPRIDAATKAAEVDAIAPAHLVDGLRTLKGRLVILTGRIDGDAITFGDAATLKISDLATAARDSDVSLVLLHSASAAQPGASTWLWQTTAVDGLAEAASKTTYGDFLDALAARRGGMALDAARDSFGRIRIAALPTETGVVDAATNAIGDLVGHVTGEIAQAGAQIYTRDRDAQQEADARLIPFLPAFVPIVYLSGLIAGTIGFSMARSWWRRFTPQPAAKLSMGRVRRFFRALPGEAMFALVFLPAVGWFALAYQTLAQAVALVIAPFRWLRRVFIGGAT